MSEQPPPGPSDEQPFGQPAPPSYPSGYGSPAGYPAASGGVSLDLGRLVFIAGWVVLSLFTAAFLYGLGQDYNGEDVADRLFNLAPTLGTGLFYAGALLGISTWLSRNS